MIFFRAVFFIAMTHFATAADATLELPLLFSDGMILQRDQAIHVWGWGKPGNQVQVTLDGKTANTVVVADGSWQLYLPKLNAGGPYKMTVQSGEEAILIKDLLIGDVWICSGQSNMEFSAKDVVNASKEMANAKDGKLRHFKVPKSWAIQPEKQLAGGEWQATSLETVGDFTAVGYFFARELRSTTDVPMGLINTSWGGSRIEPWMSSDSLNMEVESVKELVDPIIEQDKKIQLEVQRMLARWPASDGGIVNGNAVWADPDLDDSDWIAISVPALWEVQGFAGMDGFAWYRATFRLTAKEAKKDLTLGLGSIDDSDQIWVNGALIGESIDAWNKPRLYSVAAKNLKPGLNTIAVRVEDTGGGGGIHGDPDLNFTQFDGSSPRLLSGEWKFRPGKVTLNFDDDKNQYATLLYNKMIHPIQPYSIKGVIWYQGEANAGTKDAYEYRFLFGKMISGWRNEWQQKNLPFLWVQLANFISGGDNELGSPWAVLRESQSTALDLPNTAEAVIIDIGDPNDIHPRNKQDVGHRLALSARHIAYGENKLVYSGPRFRDFDIKGNSIRLKFNHVGKGLKSRRDQKLQGFTIAGSDKQFLPADAKIEGKTVVVSHAGIKKPLAVRYAWSDNPGKANLINSEALPASPFRTDSWAILE